MEKRHEDDGGPLLTTAALQKYSGFFDVSPLGYFCITGACPSNSTGVGLAASKEEETFSPAIASVNLLAAFPIRRTGVGRILQFQMHVVEVVLIEDTAGDAVLMRQILSECTVPVNLHIALDGEQAITMLADARFKPDLVILDLNIPKISGLTLLERHEFGEAPVVVFSSSPNPNEKQRCLALGVREFIEKPMDLEELRNVIYGIVQRWVMPQANGFARM